MEKEISGDDLRSLLKAIKSSEVVESRIQLINKLADSQLPEKSDPTSLLDCLLTLWEDFTCLDVSQCMLNKTILHVAAKFLKADTSRCIAKFLTLGAKASMWCGKHLRMTLMSMGDSQEEEHSSLFSQLILELLEFSVSCFSLFTTSPVFGNEVLRDAIENFILEQLNLVKDLISESKRIDSFGSEIIKATQLVLDAITKLCRAYSQSVNWDLFNAKNEEGKSSTDSKEAANLNLVISIIKCTIVKFCEMGILAANGEKSLVPILNLSWKGVVSLLQLGKVVLAEKVNVAEIITSLISLAYESLKCVAEVWSSPTLEAISVTEAKRVFFPIKFYLINAVRISSQYPCQAFSVYRDITLYILVFSTFRVSLSKNALLKDVGEMVEEHLKPTALHLLSSFLNSVQLKKELKLQFLDWMLGDESNSDLKYADQISDFQITSLKEIFSVTSETMSTARILLLGRVSLFIDLLKVSPDLDEPVVLVISRKLQWFLDVLVNEEVYSSLLVLQIPASNGNGNTSALNWHPMFSSLLHAMKIFMIVVSSTEAWSEMEVFLLENFFHPHFLCGEIVTELWSFMIRHGVRELVNSVIDKLCSLYKFIASSDSVLFPGSSVRKMARSICMLLSCCTHAVADRVYSSIVTDERSHLSLVMYTALLMEGFQLSLLSDHLRTVATERIITDYCHFMENFNESSMNSCSSDVFGIPVFILSAVLQSMQVSVSEIDSKTLKFLVSVIHGYRNSADRIIKNQCCQLLSGTLGIISAARHINGYDQMEQVILELQNLFISRRIDCDPRLHECKPALTVFMGSLGHMEMDEHEGSAKSSAVWELYHMLLREKHWALAHLSITAFGYFAARTSCNHLWRFVPQDAALSFDLESGNAPKEERFMSELKVFLEKEMARLTTAPSSEQLSLVMEDGLLLKELIHVNSDINIESVGGGKMEIDGESPSNKRRKLPDGFTRGMELLQSGLGVLSDSISLWQHNHGDYAELPDKILTHFGHLEDTIHRLAGLADDA